MASFTTNVITNKGIDLRSKTDAGATLELRRLVMGNGVAAQGTDLKTMTALVNELKGFDIHSKLFLGSGRTRVRTILSNAGMLTGFFAKEVGIIANDPDEGEILYAYGLADPGDWIPPETEAFQQVFDSNLITGNTQDITVTLAPDAATMTLMDMQDHELKQLDPADTNTDKDKHLSNAQAKVWEDHKNASHAPSNANYYIHPGTHPPAIIAETTSDRFVSDAEKATWNGKANLGETSLTAYRGDRGKMAYDHSQSPHTSFPVGTSMLFSQASAPVGWTKKSDWDAYRSIIVGNVFGDGGTDTAISHTTAIVVGDHSVHSHVLTVDSHILTVAEMPPHAHTLTSSASIGGSTLRNVAGTYLSGSDFTSNPSGGGGGHNHTAASANGGPTNHSITQDTYTPKYQIVIAATKD